MYNEIRKMVEEAKAHEEATMMTFEKTEAVKALKEHYEKVTRKKHLSELLQDRKRNEALRFKVLDKVWLDYTHTKIDS